MNAEEFLVSKGHPHSKEQLLELMESYAKQCLSDAEQKQREVAWTAVEDYEKYQSHLMDNPSESAKSINGWFNEWYTNYNQQ